MPAINLIISMLDNQFLQKEEKDLISRNWATLTGINLRDCNILQFANHSESLDSELVHINFMNNQKKLLWLTRTRQMLNKMLNSPDPNPKPTKASFSHEKIRQLSSYMDQKFEDCKLQGQVIESLEIFASDVGQVIEV